MSPHEALAHSLKVKFGTSPFEPSDVQLHSILNEIEIVRLSGKQPSEQDWSNAVMLHCPSAGRFKYAGIDNSDLNTLLALAMRAANKGS